MKNQITAIFAAILMTLTAVPFAASAAEQESENDIITEQPEAQEYVYFNITRLPDKLEYQVGEELDLTGGEAMAAGFEEGIYWDSFYRPFDFFTVDASAFDSSKPGIYTISVTCKGIHQSVTKTFDVTVTDSVKTELHSKANAADFILGDLNDDGVVDIMDVIMLNKYVIGTNGNLSDKALLAADMNGDGIVNSTDALLLLKKVTE